MLNRLKTMTLVLLTSVTLAVSITHAKTTEKLALNKQGIKVWTYQTANNPVMQYRAETILDTTLENAVGLVLDIEYGKKWIPYVSDLKIVERSNDGGQFVMYMQMDFPFPLADRDLVVQGKISKEKDGKIIIKNQAIKDSRIPVKSNIVRIHHYEGDWIFQQLDPQQVKVTTSGFADPAGAIPTSFVNSFVQQQPYQMLQRMKEQVKTPRYTVKDLPPLLR